MSHEKIGSLWLPTNYSTRTLVDRELRKRLGFSPSLPPAVYDWCIENKLTDLTQDESYMAFKLKWNELLVPPTDPKDWQITVNMTVETRIETPNKSVRIVLDDDKPSNGGGAAS